jgi:hypothetical protein
MWRCALERRAALNTTEARVYVVVPADPRELITGQSNGVMFSFAPTVRRPRGHTVGHPGVIPWPSTLVAAAGPVPSRQAGASAAACLIDVPKGYVY